ncbi:MAG: capsid protein [Schleiferilactobacillus perolens]|uniref:phage tail tube protein n=1 Tax=Schleiferilactobacillus perolens TaxID=100468 RepID=UPI0039EB6953
MAGNAVAPTGLRLNSENQFFVDTQGNTDLTNLKQAKLVWLANGVQGATFANNETAVNNDFYNMKGFGSTFVTGKRLTIAMTGLHVVDDEAQGFIASKFLAVGNDLRTLFVWKSVSGDLMAGVVTLQNIVPTGGNANAFETFSVTIAFEGKPKKVTADQVTLPAVAYVGDDVDSTPATANTAKTDESKVAGE